MTYLQLIGEVIGFLLLSTFAILDGIIKSFIPKKYKMKNIGGEIALVTGGGGGLGRLLSLRLANLGAIVIIWDINETGIEETVKLVQAAGGTCYGYVCNLCDRTDIYKKAKIIREEIGKVTVLINNAGIVTGMKFLDTPDELIIKTMDVNIMSHFWTVKAFLPTMLENNKGHIVSVASLAGQCGIPKLIDYCASKFAAMGFDEALRMELEYEGYNINTTVVCPYFIRSTGMFDDVQSRYIPTLSPNAVADRIIMAMRCNEKYAIIPGYLQILLTLKWIFPWPCVAMFLRGLVRDVSPSHENSKSCAVAAATVAEKECIVPSKDRNGAAIHQQLARRISSPERKP
ncbi:Short-chain dehydrogenase/reductase family 16C member 6 [Trachymyrmex zeteki]|uniref:Short-chain dehydrogenase/reductase family 16C member 6 n=1 Tax=Mycetomoellerius zeteki TaxID=64791 RepID=A0A151X0X8_9HYME|nr:PREDICTED: short-chain dehydrogenase/reductase family 16C member 6-like [Trachymyrmex zeteki]XP_018305878.1 PREDICTED: short-chain dehydrogenase/reductase family 16C member 6-like [Trachymyrmex zeteki]XP_018305879.1 PREDICTED: short-chain dehydrogenase/reductase family 16C member 6-like [Trachymyrmex zeteki]KYQ53824.1 Short-chain dehydrogenase/reductase family 16C member 6 [Trachymyrmex zeteki]